MSQLSQIAISPFGECADTPPIFCVSNDNDAFEAVTPVTACDRRSQESKETVTVSHLSQPLPMRFVAQQMRLVCHSVTVVTGQEIGFQLPKACGKPPHTTLHRQMVRAGDQPPVLA